jgi:hypothetical protein
LPGNRQGFFWFYTTCRGRAFTSPPENVERLEHPPKRQASIPERDDRPGNGDALLLTTGKLDRQNAPPILESDHFQALIVTVPASGRNMPEIMLSSVVLPLPDGPTMNTISPNCATSATSSTAFIRAFPSPNHLLSPLETIAG